MREGQQVEVTLRTAGEYGRGEGLRRSAGALSDTWRGEDDEILDRLQQQRQLSTGRELPS
jgi:hypothetical protein